MYSLRYFNLEQTRGFGEAGFIESGLGLASDVLGFVMFLSLTVACLKDFYAKTCYNVDLFP